MADGDIVVGERPTKKLTAIVDDLAASAGASKKDRPQVCRAMSQQRSDFYQPSQPQKFVRLVGCHDPKAGRVGGR